MTDLLFQKKFQFYHIHIHSMRITSNYSYDNIKTFLFHFLSFTSNFSPLFEESKPDTEKIHQGEIANKELASSNNDATDTNAKFVAELKL